MITSLLSRPARLAALLPFAAVLAFAACDDDSTDSSSTPSATTDGGTTSDASAEVDATTATDAGATADDGCSALCTASGFTGGTETDFNNGLVECQCAGTGGEVTKTACEGYCAPFGVSAADSLLSAGEGEKPAKCVCDGTDGT